MFYITNYASIPRAITSSTSTSLFTTPATQEATSAELASTSSSTQPSEAPQPRISTAAIAKVESLRARAVARRLTNIARFETIFDLDVIDKHKGKKITVTTYPFPNFAPVTEVYDSYIKVTVNADCTLKLKEIFEALQIYPCLPKAKGNEKGFLPAVVSLTIGGLKSVFTISPWTTDLGINNNQAFISICFNEDYEDFHGHSYGKIIAALGHTLPQLSAAHSLQLAEAVSASLDLSIQNQGNILADIPLDSYKKPYLIELIALTQTGESVSGLVPGAGRAPLMDKLARQLLRTRSAMDTTLGYNWDLFINRFSYPPADIDGTKRGRALTDSPALYAEYVLPATVKALEDLSDYDESFS